MLKNYYDLARFGEDAGILSPEQLDYFFERVHLLRYDTRPMAKLDIVDWIEGFYNPRRRHTSVGNISPAEFERQMSEAA